MKRSKLGKHSNQRRLRFESLELRQLLAITTLGADADTYVRDSTPRGSSTILDTMDRNGAGDWVTYVRFDLSGVDIDQIEDATLFLYKTSEGTQTANDVPGRFDVYGLTNAAGNTAQNWSEASLSLSNVGAEYSSANGVNPGQLYNLDDESGAETYEHTPNAPYAALKLSGPDLVSFLNDRVDENGLATFVTIIDAGNVRGWAYASKEHSEATLRPLLKIQHSTVAPESDPYPSSPVSLPRQVEDLNRGLVAVRRNSSEVYLSWRMLGLDPSDIAFNVYRKSNGGSAIKLNPTPITSTTDFVDQPSFLESHEYYVVPVISGVEQAPSESALLSFFPPIRQYIDVPLSIPPAVNGHSYTANDASVGDLDGDGDYEFVVKWVTDATVPPDEAPMFLDAYQMDGTHMWRIDLGRNISSQNGGNAAAMQFAVYDLDGDGKAEVAMNTAPGAKDGLGNWVLEPGDDETADFRSSNGFTIAGPEYFTVFDGMTGGVLENVPLGPARGTIQDWGDAYGHRATTFHTAIAYLDGQRPSVVIGRGIYHPIGAGHGSTTAKTEITAYDWRNGVLTERWTFTAIEGTPTNNVNPRFVGQGNHNISIGDVDGDGFDEIVWGSMVVDHDGSGLHSTDLGHGDALHMSDMDPSNPGLEVFKPNENPGEYGDAGAILYDAQTGEKLAKLPPGGDVGRGVALDIDGNSPGYEMWAPTAGTRYIYGIDGTPLYEMPSNMFNNFGVWWDADPLRELLDGTTISKWNFTDTDPVTPGVQPAGRSNFDLDPAVGGTQQYAPGSSSNNGTKSTPALSGDILGDWREEVVWRKSDSSALRIFTTTIDASMRMPTLMHDTQYRVAIAWQNDYYNQPPHPSFFLGEGMSVPPTPNIYLAGSTPTIPGDFDGDGNVNDVDLGIWESTYNTSPGAGNFGDADNDNLATGLDFLIWQQNHTSPSTLAAAGSAGGGSVAAAMELEESGLAAESVDSAFSAFSLAGLPASSLAQSDSEADEPSTEVTFDVESEPASVADIDDAFESDAMTDGLPEDGQPVSDAIEAESEGVDFSDEPLLASPLGKNSAL